MCMDYEVIVAGGGPVGLLLACELQLAGVSVLVIERNTDIDPTIKAGSINVPSVETFYRRGMLPQLQEAQQRQMEQFKDFIRQRLGDAAAAAPPPRIAGHFGGIMLSADRVDGDDPAFADRGAKDGAALISQQEIECLLGKRAGTLGVEIWRGCEVTGFDAGADGVTVEVGDRRVRAGWLVGCDGGRSTVRRLAGFDFPGVDPEITGHQAVAELDGADRLSMGWNRTDRGVYVYGPMPGRILTVEFDGPPADRDTPITGAELQASIRNVTGVDITVTKVHTATRFTDNTRQATTYRQGRVLLAGDAAHVHSPFGGQGLNLGLGDAMNLGWKLAATVRGWAPEGLLDSYTAERHPIGAWVLEWTRAQVAFMRPDVRTRALRAVIGELMDTVTATTFFVRKIAGVLHRYDFGQGHALLGASVPDLALSGAGRVADHLHEGRAVVFDLADDAKLRSLVEGWGDRVRVVTAGCADRPELSALLVRPDGYVAWAADGSPDLPELESALTRWFGARR